MASNQGIRNQDIPDHMLDLINKFWELYSTIREDTLALEIENPANLTFASVLIAEQRNAIDYFALAFIHKDEETLRIAIKSLQEAGIDGVEYLLVGKIKQVENCIRDSQKILKRLIYPSKVREHLIGNMKLLLEYLDKGRKLKPLGYYKSAPEFWKGIDLGRKVVSDYGQSKIEGMEKGERRYNWIVIFLIGLVVGILVSIIKILLSIIKMYIPFGS